jgi:5-methylcytosine-specific restriction endonuclease McrA
MANRWGIPKDVEVFVRERDTACVYCGIKFSGENASRKSKASWEHIVNDISICGADNIALCCMSCNASKGSKLLTDWLKSEYCIDKGITSDSVAEVVRIAITHPPKLT